MPITDTLQNAKRLESVGFTAEQARGISEVVEEAVHSGQQDLKEFIRSELATLRAEMKARHEELRAEFHSALRDQLLKFVAITAAMLTIAVAIIKLFPNV